MNIDNFCSMRWSSTLQPSRRSLQSSSNSSFILAFERLPPAIDIGWRTNCCLLMCLRPQDPLPHNLQGARGLVAKFLIATWRKSSPDNPSSSLISRAFSLPGSLLTGAPSRYKAEARYSALYKRKHPKQKDFTILYNTSNMKGLNTGFENSIWPQ
ncbi:unnamed protein product [Schistosoma curassoni]|uniref:Uncharacterized protein n=1 Tax=Schistosoma curassoni TaxID=6186 RepID=A0A183KEX6_9TREM|nr:unnamed protein product [Schistosoma curassoni]